MALENYIHYLTLDYSIRCMELLILSGKYQNSDWSVEIDKSFSGAIKGPPDDLVYGIQSKIEDKWGKKKIYKFLSENPFSNLIFKLDFGDRANKNRIKPSKFCKDAPNNVTDIHFSLNSFLSEYI